MNPSVIRQLADDISPKGAKILFVLVELHLNTEYFSPLGGKYKGGFRVLSVLP
jgi:hypothetical protein